MGGDYFIRFCKGEGDLTISRICRECDGRKFMVFVPVPIICGKKLEYMIEVDDKISFQYVHKFARRCEVDNFKSYTMLKLRSMYY